MRTKCSIVNRNYTRASLSEFEYESRSLIKPLIWQRERERERATNQKAESRNAIDRTDAQSISWNGQTFARDLWIGCNVLSPDALLKVDTRLNTIVPPGLG